jgi:hypothetical protein
LEKRRFLAATMAAAAAAASLRPVVAAPKVAARVLASGPTLLTVTGAIGAGNRGPFDPALDQLMAKQKLAFTKAQTFDFAALVALPAITIRPTLEYDSKPHALTGPLLIDVMKASGVAVSEKTVLFVRAIDGYAAQIPAGEASRRRFIVATHLDARPMALGGLGPLWTVYDADRFPEMAAKPIGDRFGSCPWATYHVEVKDA